MRRFVLFAVLVCVLGCGCASAQDAAAEPWPLAVRIMSYGAHQDEAWAHLRSIGVRHVFMQAPAPDGVDALAARLKEHGLDVPVFRGEADLAKDSYAADLEPQLAVCEKMGVKFLFLSAKPGDTPLETVYARLRAAGDAAQQHGVTLTLETHPPLGANGGTQVATMKGVNHPNVRVNYDTANITYYNRDTDAVAELKKSLDYVRTVEFKDHTGGFETWDFPVTGKGVVDFKAVTALLVEHGYDGPVTIEFEGTKGVDLTKEELFQAIADSVAFVRTLGNFD